MSDVQITPGALVALLELLRDCYDRGVGGETFLQQFRLHCTRHGWDWFAPDCQKQFNRRAMLLCRSHSYASYSRQRRHQLCDEGFSWWAYCADPNCVGAHAPFDGVALPPDHGFWRQHYPPVCAGCACYVVGAGSAAGIARLGGDLDKPLPAGWSTAFAGESDVWRLERAEDYLAILGIIASGDLDHID